MLELWRGHWKNSVKLLKCSNENQLQLCQCGVVRLKFEWCITVSLLFSYKDMKNEVVNFPFSFFLAEITNRESNDLICQSAPWRMSRYCTVGIAEGSLNWWNGIVVGSDLTGIFFWLKHFAARYQMIKHKSMLEWLKMHWKILSRHSILFFVCYYFGDSNTLLQDSNSSIKNQCWNGWRRTEKFCQNTQ